MSESGQNLCLLCQVVETLQSPFLFCLPKEAPQRGRFYGRRGNIRREKKKELAEEGRGREDVERLVLPLSAGVSRFTSTTREKSEAEGTSESGYG